MERALGRSDRDLNSNGTVFYRGDTVYSYGEHFPMAIIMRERPRAEEDRVWEARHSPSVGAPSWVLVNGDLYSVTTSQHQALVRDVIANTHLASIIVPFTALRAARIELASIEPIDVRDDRVEEWEEQVEPTGEFLKRPVLMEAGGLQRDDEGNVVYEAMEDRRHVRGDTGPVAHIGANGRWYVSRARHWLGDSLFSAKVAGRRKRFLSSFDYQEARPLYFLCEMPRSSKAQTVEEAYEDLKPEAVKQAERAGLEPTRQGDMFAIPTNLSTREVKLLTPHRKGRIVKRPKRGLLGTNHTASEVMFATYGRVYARGLLYHAPGPHRDPDHARRKMGDGKTWHLLTKNTVPRAQATPRTREFA
jgi:hypothetical protein